MGGVFDTDNATRHGSHHLSQTKRRYPVTCKSPVSLSYMPLSGDFGTGHANFATLFRHEKRKSYVAQSKPPVGGAAKFRSDNTAPPATGSTPEWTHGPATVDPAAYIRYGGLEAESTSSTPSVPICFVYAIYKRSVS